MENNHMLVETHMDLVVRMAKQMMKKEHQLRLADRGRPRREVSPKALVAAAHTYDASREASFKTYATTCIRNAMLAEIRNMFPVKVNEQQTKKNLVRNDEIRG